MPLVTAARGYELKCDCSEEQQHALLLAECTRSCGTGVEAEEEECQALGLGGAGGKGWGWGKDGKGKRGARDRGVGTDALTADKTTGTGADDGKGKKAKGECDVCFIALLAWTMVREVRLGRKIIVCFFLSLDFLSNECLLERV